MRRVGQGDIYSLHGPVGERACTWFDEELEVCWFLGFSPQHNYEEFERRASRGELVPSEEDFAIVYQERGDFEYLVTSGVEALVTAAWRAHGVPQRGTVGGLLALEVTAIVIEIDVAPGESALGALYLLIQQPPLKSGRAAPANWPGAVVLGRLAEIATGQDYDTLDAQTPVEVPSGDGSLRPVDFAKELAIEILTTSVVQ